MSYLANDVVSTNSGLENLPYSSVNAWTIKYSLFSEFFSTEILVQVDQDYYVYLDQQVFQSDNIVCGSQVSLLLPAG